MLAQISDKAVEIISEKISEGVSEGLKITAANAPTNWVQMIVAVAALVGLVVVVFCFLRHLDKQDAKADEREAKRQTHFESITEKFASDGRISQRECHAHSKEMMQKRSEDTECLKEISHDLKDAVSDLKDVAKDTKAVVATAMTRLQQGGMGS